MPAQRRPRAAHVPAHAACICSPAVKGQDLQQHRLGVLHGADWRAVTCSGQLGAQRQQDDHQGGRACAGMMLPRFPGTLIEVRF